MKNMNMKKRYWIMNLQVFAGDGEGDDPGDESGDDDDDPGDDGDDSDDDGKETSRRKLERNRTARLKPERIAVRMTMPKHRNSVIKLPRQMRWR